ncbi:hypothetical protein D3C83_179950 [compost metagenome]
MCAHTLDDFREPPRRHTVRLRQNRLGIIGAQQFQRVGKMPFRLAVPAPRAGKISEGKVRDDQIGVKVKRTL